MPNKFPMVHFHHFYHAGMSKKETQRDDDADADGRVGKVEDRPPAKVHKVNHRPVPELIDEVAGRTPQGQAEPDSGTRVLEKISLLDRQADAAAKRGQREKQRPGSRPQRHPAPVGHPPDSEPGGHSYPLPQGQTANDQHLGEPVEAERSQRGPK